MEKDTAHTESEIYVYRVNDIMKMFNVGRNKAYQILKSIRMVCGGGRLGSNGVLKTEFDYWYNNISTDVKQRL